MNLNPFAKKKSEESAPQFEGPPGPPGPRGSSPPSSRIVPTDEVKALSSRGVPEPDIIRTLRREGYATGEIDQAMKDALRSRISDGPPAPQTQQRYGSQLDPNEDFPTREQVPNNLSYPGSNIPQQEPLPPPPSYQPQAPPEIPNMPTGNDFNESPPPRKAAPLERKKGESGMGRREMEELAEVIVEEKLRELRDKFRTIDNQFQSQTKQMETILNVIEKMKSEKSGEVKGIETKIDEYSRNMGEYNGRIESLEKALKDTLAPMMESIRSLSELVKTMKEKKE